MKRYSLHFMVKERDPLIHPEYVLGQYSRLFGYSNNIKALRGKVKKAISIYPDAYDFRIFDHAFDDFEPTAFEHCICKRKTVADKWEDCAGKENQ